MGKGNQQPQQSAASQPTYSTPSRTSTLSSGQLAVDNNLGDYVNAHLKSNDQFYGHTPQQLYPLHYQQAQFPTFNPQSYYSMLYNNFPNQGGSSLQNAFQYQPPPNASNPFQWGGSANTAPQRPAPQAAPQQQVAQAAPTKSEGSLS